MIPALPAGSMPMVPTLVAMRGITKHFGSVAANDGIDLDLQPGEIHALLGENGAGKSTLVKMLYGLIQPSAGRINFSGQTAVLQNPDAARALGIGMVFQHFALFDNLTVAENIALALPKAEGLRELAERIKGIGARYGLKLEAERPVWSLSAGERQRIEIARCLLQDPKVLILDEPTSVLTPQEVENLFTILNRLKAEGRAVLYISHKLDEVQRLCDRATILRMGKVVATCIPAEENARSLAALMVGAQIADVKLGSTHVTHSTRLEVRGLNLPASGLHNVALRDVSFDVRGGEILGIAGIAGNGQSELFAALSGEALGSRSDSVWLDGAQVGRTGINQRRQRNAAFAPEERNGHAADPNVNLSDNVLLSRHAIGGLTYGGFVRRSAAQALAARITAVFDVRKSGADPLARTLSGGNLQKFVVGREILRHPGILVVNQPTWGVDALAARFIRQALVDLAQTGAAVLVISQDLDELFEICDRMAVINHGHVSASVKTSQTSRTDIGLLMANMLEEPPDAS